MKTKLLRKLRNKIQSTFQYCLVERNPILVERNPIDVRNDILSEVYRIRKRKNIKPKALYTNDFGENSSQIL